jgi:hypothetical protein
LIAVFVDNLSDEFCGYAETVEDESLDVLENPLGMQTVEDSSQWSGVEVIFGQGLVHSFGSPGHTADIDGRGVDDGPLDGCEVEVPPYVRIMA